MNTRKLIALLLCAAMVSVAFLPSCGETANSDPNSTTAAPNGETPTEGATEEQGRANTPDKLPADLDFKGEKFTILSRTEFFYGTEMSVDEENGDIVNDAIYRRNKSVEDRLNVAIDVIKIPGIWGQEANFNSAVKKSVSAGDNLYDLIAGYAYFITPLSAEGMFLNLKNVPHIDYSQPWWSKDLADKMTVDNKLYFMSGDLSTSMIASMMVVYFNKRIQQDYSVDNLYQVVLDGKWTIDKMTEYCKDIYKDLDGDGKQNDADLYGGGFEMGNYIDGLIVSQNIPFTELGDDGYPKLVLNNAKTISAFDKIYNLMFNTNGVYAVPEKQERPTLAMFINGQSLFNMGMLSLTEDMRVMKDDYGILPFPKYDELQKDYMSFAQDAYSLFSIPATNDRLELVGATIEALAAESYRYVTPAYFETALKVKYSRDEVSSQMLDIIRDGITFDFAFVNSNSMNNIMHIFRSLTDAKKNDFVSQYEKTESAYQKALDKLITAYKALD